MQLAHHSRHRPALAGHVSRSGAAELLAACIAACLLQIRILQEAMQKRGMRGIHADFKALQPVRMPQAFEGEAVGGGGSEAI
jgi:hypothetical protein